MAEYALFGEVAKQVQEGYATLEAEKIEIGMKHLAYNKYMRDTLPSLVTNYQLTDNLITFTISDIPVEIVLLHNDYQFMKNPDKKFFLAETFSLPNPFNSYWKVRGLIK